MTQEVERSSRSACTNFASEAQGPSTSSNAAGGVGSIPTGRAKLYAIVRASLEAGSKACQAAHALREYAEAYPFVEAAWWRASNTLVLLETEDLEALELAARAADVTCVRFVEPDWAPEGTLTALVLGPDGKRLVRGLALAFSGGA
jgi:hypothetical protein